MPKKHVVVATNAYKKIPFYKDKYSSFFSEFDEITDSNFCKLPVTTKQDIQSNLTSFYNNLDVIGKECYFFNTSGSTGIPLKILWSKEDYVRSMFSLIMFRKKHYAINPDDKLCSFHSVSYTNSSLSPICISTYCDERVLSLDRYIYDENKLEQYVNYIFKFKPVWIQAPVSVLLVLYSYLKKRAINFPFLKYIELNGEYVQETTRTMLSNYFNIPVSNMYGAIEFNGIGITCKNGRMHVLADNVYIEEDYFEGTKQLLITSLTNNFMPLVRYAIGDIGELQTVFCDCGCNEKTINLKRGRTNELIKDENNAIFDPAVITGVIRLINSDKFLINQYNVKISKNLITIYLFTENCHLSELNSKKAIINRLLNKHINIWKDIVIEVYTLDDCALLSSMPKNSFVFFEDK